jgi:hypothetical protein
MRSRVVHSFLVWVVLVGACGDGSSDAGDESGSESESESESGDGDGDGDGELMCGDEWAEKDPDTMAPDLMQTWGAACEIDDDCKTILGEDNAMCVVNILDVYTTPGGYCTRPCMLPDSATLYVADAEDCDPDGGVTCLGAMGIFSVCAPPCTMHEQCTREGYGCINMPQISMQGDPKFCLMSPEACMVAG